MMMPPTDYPEDHASVENIEVGANPPPNQNSENLASEEIAGDELDLEIAQLRQSANEYKDKYLRGLAESENVRKRLQKERQEVVQYALQNVIIDFLTPIDQLENALKFTQQASDEVKNWAIGFQMILSQFKDVLTTNRVTTFETVGQPFDHDVHEAIEMVASEAYPPGTVVEEVQRGYKIGGERTLRPARVKVAMVATETISDEPTENEKNN